MLKRLPEVLPLSLAAIVSAEATASTGLPAFSVLMAGNRLDSLKVRRTGSGMVASLKLGDAGQQVSEWQPRNSKGTLPGIPAFTARRVG